MAKDKDVTVIELAPDHSGPVIIDTSLGTTRFILLRQPVKSPDKFWITVLGENRGNDKKAKRQKSKS